MGAWNAATLDERHQLLTMMLDAVYVDMTQGLVLGLKPKPEFLPLFNLAETVTTGDSELVTGGMEQSRTIPETRAGGVGGDHIRRYGHQCNGTQIDSLRVPWRSVT